MKAVQYGSDYRGADDDPAAVEATDEAMAGELGNLAQQFATLTGTSDDDGDGNDQQTEGVQVLGPDNEIRNYAPALPFAQVGLPRVIAVGR